MKRMFDLRHSELRESSNGCGVYDNLRVCSQKRVKIYVEFKLATEPKFVIFTEFNINDYQFFHIGYISYH